MPDTCLNSCVAQSVNSLYSPVRSITPPVFPQQLLLAAFRHNRIRISPCSCQSLVYPGLNTRNDPITDASKSLEWREAPGPALRALLR